MPVLVRGLRPDEAETTADEPSDTPVGFSGYEDWPAPTWRQPCLDHALTTVVVVDERIAAFRAAQTDGVPRYRSGMTGTVRAFRGRGMAKLARNGALHRARAAGCTDAYTGNSNGSMPAANRWFGYEISATEVRHVREIG